MIIVNLLSACTPKVPCDQRVRLVLRSIIDGWAGRELPVGLDDAWHLTCSQDNRETILRWMLTHTPFAPSVRGYTMGAVIS